MIFFGSDFDGTLRRNGVVSQEDRQAIREFRRRGHKFGVVTGRTYDVIIDLLDTLELPYDILICNNGAAAFGPDGRQLFVHYMPIEGARQVAEYFHGLDLIAYGISDGLHISTGPYKGHSILYTDVDRETIDESELLDAGKANGFFSVYHSHEDMLSAADHLKRHFSDFMEVHISGLRSIDTTPKGVSKTTGIMEVKDLLGCDEIFTIGDAVNDMTMIADFGGFAVENAEDQVKAVASRVVPSVAAALEFLLNRDAAPVAPTGR